MLPVALASDTVTLLARQVTGQDDRGNDIYTDVPTIFAGVSVQPRMDTELETSKQDFATDKWRMYGPPDIDLTAGDHLLWNGLDLEVDGTPMEWTTIIPHSETNLVRWSG